jgi:hypothetical protein
VANADSCRIKDTSHIEHAHTEMMTFVYLAFALYLSSNACLIVLTLYRRTRRHATPELPV